MRALDDIHSQKTDLIISKYLLLKSIFWYAFTPADCHMLIAAKLILLAFMVSHVFSSDLT